MQVFWREQYTKSSKCVDAISFLYWRPSGLFSRFCVLSEAYLQSRYLEIASLRKSKETLSISGFSSWWILEFYSVNLLSDPPDMTGLNMTQKRRSVCLFIPKWELDSALWKITYKQEVKSSETVGLHDLPRDTSVIHVRKTLDLQQK